MAYDLLHPYYEFVAFMVNMPSMIIPSKTAGNAAKIAAFSLCIFLIAFECQYSSDCNLTADLAGLMVTDS